MSLSSKKFPPSLSIFGDGCGWHRIRIPRIANNTARTVWGIFIIYILYININKSYFILGNFLLFSLLESFGASARYAGQMKGGHAWFVS